MHVDAITLAAVADEWRTLLANARIDTIIQPTAYAIALQCYTPGGQEAGGHNRWLYLSAHPQMARAHITALKPPKIASEPPPFVMLMRKYLEGARIETIEQLRWERVLEIIIGHRAPDGAEHDRVRYRLIIEIMGRLSNIICCNEHGLILDSLKHIGADVNRYRTIAPNIQYVPPPPQQRLFMGQSLPRLEPSAITADSLALCLASERAIAAEEEQRQAIAPPELPTRRKKQGNAQPNRLSQVLSQHLLGFSPLLAREAVYRALGDAEAPLERADAHYEQLAQSIRSLASLFDSHQWQPTLAERIAPNAAPAALATPIECAPYHLSLYAHIADIRLRQSPSINVLLDDYFARAEWHDALEGVRAPIRKVLQAQLERARRKTAQLQQDIAATQEAPRHRLHAELLLAQQQDAPHGLSTVTLPNIFSSDEQESDNPTITIALDPRLDAVGNANRLFNKYHKLRRAVAILSEQAEQNAAEIATIEQLLADLALADTPTEVALVKAEVQSAGYMRGAPPAKAPKAPKAPKKGKGGKQVKGKPVPPGGGIPLTTRSRDGFAVLIGKNSRQNEEVTFRQAASNDIWLHARGIPGAHVIIKAAGRDIPHSTIEHAAALAAYYSQARGNTSVPVDYTLQRHVRHMKGGGPGMVIYERERTLNVAPLPLA